MLCTPNAGRNSDFQRFCCKETKSKKLTANFCKKTGFFKFTTERWSTVLFPKNVIERILKLFENVLSPVFTSFLGRNMLFLPHFCHLNQNLSKCAKNTEKIYFEQCLEWPVPKHCSKYTTICVVN